MVASTVLAGLGLSGCSAAPSCAEMTEQSACAGNARPSTPITPMPTFTEGVGLSEWLPYKAFSVRVLDYQRDALASSRPDRRLDVVVVEECGPGGRPSVVAHDHWMLVGPAGEVLGRATGKVVRGTTTVDPPAALAPGTCQQSSLVVAVPPDSDPVSVRDGVDATWVISTS